ncbi:memo-like protein [Plasmodium ovale wallikeri]|uniref:Memo-like protein n=1 Tax=Plasmodium ovale wallikeri TaxID=864142 RepID=A0A1A8YLF4_PLAOA|nr:memo-like protein [Plasmodium ovale wallikeri]
MSKYRRAHHAGSWYSNNGNALRTSIGSFFEKVNFPKQNVKAAICPHAGYAYCLETNSHVYSCIDVKNVKNIFILGPNHHIYNKGCLLPQVEKYETPLGFLEINKSIILDIMNSDKNNLYDYIEELDDEEEHSIEMQLPLIKYIIKDKDIKIIPIYVGCIGNDSDYLLKYNFMSNNGNFTGEKNEHSNSFSFTNILQKYHDKYVFKQIENMDMDAANIISRHDIADFIDYLNKTHNTICGSNPIKIMLHLIQNYSGNVSTKLMHYSQSNQAQSANDSSVSYAGMVSAIN